MFGGKRKRYNGDVASLLPAFGFNLEEAGVMKTLNALDIAWDQGYSPYEGALYVAYLVFSGMLKTKEPRAQSVLEKIRFVQTDWVTKGIVRKEIAARFSAKADEWQRMA